MFALLALLDTPALAQDRDRDGFDAASDCDGQIDEPGNLAEENSGCVTAPPGEREGGALVVFGLIGLAWRRR